MLGNIGSENGPRQTRDKRGGGFRKRPMGPLGSQMEVAMATFIVLASFSDQGIKNIKQSIERADAFKQMAAKVGATVKDIY